MKNFNIWQKIGAGILLFILLNWAVSRVTKYRPPKPKVDGNSLDPNYDYEAFTLKLNSVIQGLDATWVKAPVFEELLYMNDEEFKLIYNLYNDRYAKGKNTLRSDIEDEWFWGSGRTALTERFRRLNLP